MPQRVVRVVLEGHPRRGVPLGVLLAEALLGVRPEPQLLALTKLHQYDVYGVLVKDARRTRTEGGEEINV